MLLLFLLIQYCPIERSGFLLITEVISLLVSGEPLPPKYKEHALIGNYVGYLECHGRPDLLLIYQRDMKNGVIKLYRVGSHTQLFK
ncbi:type II toxin-antitoxin system YafQ family toxin [Gallibacterium anatis]|uniref:type II toxin-antitoxin system YafQ family toxin n=1 Tax=Gallibacterium anatis TaxID=750 RepID=UPI000BA065BA|nr:type II toxin-antitoxin system YafQ family toxin [Gallibacterium anatis]WAX72500.1 type II toxin-antitoxin system YafQ family toxin [Gallibacterium anatis]